MSTTKDVLSKMTREDVLEELQDIRSRYSKVAQRAKTTLTMKVGGVDAAGMSRDLSQGLSLVRTLSKVSVTEMSRLSTSEKTTDMCEFMKWSSIYAQVNNCALEFLAGLSCVRED